MLGETWFSWYTLQAYSSLARSKELAPGVINQHCQWRCDLVQGPGMTLIVVVFYDISFRQKFTAFQDPIFPVPHMHHAHPCLHQVNLTHFPRLSTWITGTGFYARFLLLLPVEDKVCFRYFIITHPRTDPFLKLPQSYPSCHTCTILYSLFYNVHIYITQHF